MPDRTETKVRAWALRRHDAPIISMDANAYAPRLSATWLRQAT